MTDTRALRGGLLPRGWRRGLIALLVMAMLAPLSLPFAYAAGGRGEPQVGAGMSTRKKVVLLAGAALLYYLWKKHQANQARKNGMANGGVTANARQPQLYRSKNGGVYYRDAQGQPVWLTVPQQGMQVPSDEVVRYAPDYASYRGPAPRAPRGYRSQPFSQYDPNAAATAGGM